MLYYSRLGLKPKDWIPMVASKHEASKEAVRRDWSERKTWIRMLLKIDDSEVAGILTADDRDENSLLNL